MNRQIFSINHKNIKTLYNMFSNPFELMSALKNKTFTKKKIFKLIKMPHLVALNFYGETLSIIMSSFVSQLLTASYI